jgi:ribosomal peptide maturation radical SAM protein 1
VTAQHPHRPRTSQRDAGLVILVGMPFLDARRPAIQLGLLKALAARDGFAARTFHANLTLAAQIGLDYYQRLSEHRGHLVGEWLFSLEAFPDDPPDPDARMLDDLAGQLSYLAGSPDELKEQLIRTRDRDIPAYLDALADSAVWAEASVVGFSSTFQQNTASFALARRLKQRYPRIFTVFGGANFSDEMGLELVRTVGCIDAAVIGEGDVAFPRLLAALAEGSDPGLVPGVATRRDGQVVCTPAAPPHDDLDALPDPDYEEYFARAEQTGLLAPGHRNVWLPIETARGCWWGAKHHCTFCGLNGTTMRFRSKSPRRVLDELARQARRYRSPHFEAVDNILDPQYLKELFPALADSDAGYEFFYEVKANLGREQLGLLARAGVTRLQPGIESLSSHVLDLMRKGIRAAQNVNLLRWARYYDIDVAWNLLWGFPGETEPDYAGQTAALPHLLHLQPPTSAGRIWLERFSPLFGEPGIARFGGVTPERSYRYIYPPGIDLGKVAYFFDYRPEGGVPESAYTAFDQAVTAWSEIWRDGRRPSLTYWSAPHFVQIVDQRQAGNAGTYTFEDTLADLYLACTDRPTTAAAVQERLGLHLAPGDIQEIFADLGQRGLMFLDGRFALSLALPSIKGR